MTAAEGPPPQGLDLQGPEVDELLRPAAELAIEMARTGLRLQPPLDPPARLRPLLAHAKLTNRALATARRVVEEDPDFRARVAVAVDAPGAEATLGRAGVLWLSRPNGWQDELAELVAAARAAAAARAEGAEERSAQRRLAHAEQARARSERTAEEAGRAAEAARAEVQEERRLRRAADDAVARAARRASSLEEQLAAARRATEGAAAQLAERAESEARAVAARAAAEAEVARLRAEVADLRAALVERPAVSPPTAGGTDHGLADADRQALREAVDAAASAAVSLGAALGRAAAALDGDADGDADADAGAPEVVDAAEPDAPAAPALRARPATRPRWARSRPRGTRRRPAPLPPLVRDDSPEAAEHLVNLPGVSLLVDGYNATLSTWPDLPLPEQRSRLVDALAELATRTGARPEVVFDGADVGIEPIDHRSTRPLVKVSFTSAEVEADDVLIARAHALPLPVVVASDDRRVRDGARAAGANVLGIEQLLAALRRKS